MKLIFVYNANAGPLNAFIDTAHKMMSPSTYTCDLCQLTFGNFKEKEAWVRFRESVTTPLIFLHKNEFNKAYKSKWLPKYDFPIVLAEVQGGLDVVISSEDFKHMNTVEELIDVVKRIVYNPSNQDTN